MRIAHLEHVESLHNQNDFPTLLYRQLDVVRMWRQSGSQFKSLRTLRNVPLKAYVNST